MSFPSGYGYGGGRQQYGGNVGYGNNMGMGGGMPAGYGVGGGYNPMANAYGMNPMLLQQQQQQSQQQNPYAGYRMAGAPQMPPGPSNGQVPTQLTLKLAPAVPMSYPPTSINLPANSNISINVSSYPSPNPSAFARTMDYMNSNKFNDESPFL